MKKEIMNILACPLCLNSLQLEVYTQSEDEIIDGILYCSNCDRKYPIKEKIPRMIPSDSLKYSNDLEIERKSYKERQIENEKKHLDVRNANITYHDIAADTYDEDEAESVHQNKFNQERIEKIIEDLSQRNDNSFFLDMGCGTGNCLKFGKKYFQHAVGVDVSVNMLKLANERDMEVIQADSLYLPFKPSTFNAVSVFSVLHHIYDYSSVFIQIGRVLKKGGFLYTDWDPQKRPLIKYTNKVNRQIYYLLSFSYRTVNFLKNKFVKSTNKKQDKHFNLKENMPEIKEIYTLAEYHEQKPMDERGVDFEAMKKSLIDSGFIDIQPTFHWAGKSFSKLSLMDKASLNLQSKLSGFPKERFMENIQTIARRSEE